MMDMGWGRRLFVAGLGVATMAVGLVVGPVAAHDASSGTRHSHPLEWRLKPAYIQWTTDNGATWVNSRPAGYDSGTDEWSNDGGVTWTATQAQYDAGEAGADSGNGPSAGMFRYRQPHDSRQVFVGEAGWSLNGGASWSGPGDREPAGFNLATAIQYSSDSGATWSATQAQYDAGEAGTDNGDGPDAGTFRSRYPHQRRQTYICTTEDGEVLYEEVVTEDGGQAISRPSASCALLHSSPYGTNVADGTQPPGDWCVSGVGAIICRGDGYTFNEAKTRLGF